MDLGNLRVVISAETAALTAGLATATAVVGRFAATSGAGLATASKNANTVAQGIGAINKEAGALAASTTKVSALGSALSSIVNAGGGFLKIAAPIALLAAAFALTIPAAIEFETAWTGVTKTVEGTVPQLDAVRTGILNMSREIPAAATEIAAVAEVAGQLGIAVPELLAFTRVMIDLGETTNLSATEAASAMARFANIMSGSANSGDVLYWERLGSAVVDLGNNLATTEAEIALFANRIGGAGAVVGLAEAEILAIGGALSSVGIFAEAGGTAVSRVLLEIDEAVDSLGTGGSDKLQKFADIAGQTVTEFARLQETDPAAAFVAVVEGLNRIEQEGGSAVQALEGVGLANIRVRDAMLRLAAAGSLLGDAIRLGNTAWAENSALTVEAERRYDTTAAKIERLGNVFNVLAVNLGTPLLGGLVAVVDGLADMVIQLDALGPALSTLADGIGSVASAFEPVAGLFGEVAATGLEVTIAAIAGAFVVLGSALQVAGAVLGGVADGIGALASSAATITATLVGMYAIFISVSAVLTTFTTVGAAAASSAAYLAGTLAPMAAAAAPILLLGAALAVVGSSFLEASSASKSFRESVDALTTNNNGVTTMEGLAAAARAAGAEYDRTAAATGGFVTGLRGMAGVLPFVSNELLNQRAVMFEAGDAMNDYEANLKVITDTLTTVGDQFGMTAAEVQVLAIAAGIDPAGLLDPNTWNGTTAAIFEAIEAFSQGEQAIVDAVTAMSEGKAEIEDFEKVFNLTGESIQFLAEQIDGIDYDDLFSDDPEDVARTAAAIQTLALMYGEMGEAAGFSAEQMIQGALAMESVTSAVGTLQGTLGQVEAAFEATAFQADNLASASAAFVDVGVAFGAGEASARSYLESMRDLTLAFAASGVGAQEALGYQRDLYNAWIESAAAAGISEQAASELAVSYGLIPETVLTQVAFEGQQAQAEADNYQLALRQLAAEEYIARASLETGIAEDKLLEITGLANLFSEGDYTALIKADGQEAIEEVLIIELALEAMTSGDYTALLGVEDEGLRTAAAQALLTLGIIDETTADAIIDADNSSADAAISDTQGDLDRLDGTTAEPSVAIRGAAEAISAAAAIALELGKIQDRSVTVTVNGNGPGTSGFGAPVSTPTTSTSNPRPAGVGPFADGGMVEYYRHGGVRENHVAQIARGSNVHRVWAEQETGGEAYIPMGGHKRARSTRILNTVARHFGYGLKKFAHGGFHDADVMHFADGGITSRTFQTNSGLPGVIVDVQVDARALGQVNVDLAPVNAALFDIASSADRATLSVGQFGSSTATIAMAAARDLGIVPVVMQDTVASADQMLTAFQRAGVGINQSVAEIGENMLRAMDVSEFLATMEEVAGWPAEHLGAHMQEMQYTVGEALDWMISEGLEMQHVWEGVFLDAASASEVFEAALDAVARAVDDVDSAVRRAESGFDTISGATRDARDAQFDYLDAIQRVKEAVGDGEVFGTISTEARRNYDDLIDAGDAMREYAIETAAAGQSAGEAIGNWRNMQDEFRALAISAGLPKAEVEALIQELFAIPESVIAEIAVEGQEAQAEIEAVQAGMDVLDGLTSTPSIDATAEGFNMVVDAVNSTLAAVDIASAEAEIDAESSEFDDAVAAVRAELLFLDAAIAVASLQADDSDLQAAYEDARRVLEEIDKTVADPDFTGDKSQFDQIAQQVNDALSGIDTTTAVPGIDADAGYFDLVVRGVRTDLTGIDTTTAIPDIKANDGEFKTAAENAKTTLNQINTYTAVPTLKVNDQASGVVSSLRTKLLSLAQNYTSTVTTRLVTDDRRADGISNVPILVQGNNGMMLSRFDHGGIRAGDYANGHLPQMLGAGDANFRLWGEPETQGESYIPHANDYRRPGALRILEQTAALMGRRVIENAGGGFYGRAVSGPVGGLQVLISPGAVHLDVDVNSGVDEQRIMEASRQAADALVGMITSQLEGTR